MAQKFAIEVRLSDRDFQAFNAYLVERRTTIDAAGAWLKKRGYRVSRGALHGYRRALLDGHAWASRGELTRSAYTRKLSRLAASLNIRPLAMLAAFGDFLAIEESN